LNILITEDEPIQAEELQAIVRDLGHQVLGVAATVHAAMRLAEHAECDLALVDVHLRDGATGPELARRLWQENGIVVIFTTSNPDGIPDDFGSACGVLTKPLSEQSIKSTIHFVKDCMTMGCATRPKPYGLSLSPAYAKRWNVA